MSLVTKFRQAWRERRRPEVREQHQIEKAQRNARILAERKRAEGKAHDA